MSKEELPDVKCASILKKQVTMASPQLEKKNNAENCFQIDISFYREKRVGDKEGKRRKQGMRERHTHRE